jgi:hypothetical protein
MICDWKVDIFLGVIKFEVLGWYIKRSLLSFKLQIVVLGGIVLRFHTSDIEFQKSFFHTNKFIKQMIKYSINLIMFIIFTTRIYCSILFMQVYLSVVLLLFIR